MQLGPFPVPATENISYAIPSNAGTLTITSLNRNIILDNALIASYAIQLTGGVDGQVIKFWCNGGITALTVTAPGWANCLGMPTTLSTNGYFIVLCSFTKSGWVRIG